MKNTRRRTAFLPLTPLGLGLLIAACSTTPPVPTQPLSPAVGAGLRQCEALAGQFRFDQTTIDSAAPVAAGGLTLGGQPVAAHCLVKGQMHKRKGSDGRDYAIGFEMRLPQAWNGRFYYQGNGGLDGNVQPAQGALGGGPVTGALVQGFAVISSDAGHSGPQTAVFGLEPQARLDYGYQAVAKLTPMAKALIANAYGKAPDRSYIGGCSNGGRHAMVAASRLGDQYDGYLIGAPGYRLPNAALAQLWGAQRWSPLATPGATVRHPLNPNASIPDLGSALNAAERQTVARAVLNRCDALDGLKDGLVQATQACQAAFDVARDVPTCSGARDGSCLTPAQKTVLAQVHAGGKASNGQPIYSAFPYDPGIAGNNWATWKFVNSVALDPLSVGTVFTAPPAAAADIAGARIDVLLPAISATSDTYKESGLALMSPPGHEKPTNLQPLRARGAKMVLYHGVSDAIFSAEDTRQWFERLNTAQGGKASDFARYFPVPGMNHCSAGPTADQFDLLGPLVKWVEQGVAPQAVTASARGAGNAGGVNAELPADWATNRTRPLCAYPTVATYNGSGPIESASSFSCR
ncbi:tannase/feruloyl esterase family alpha/beta hydrolase [Hydrogenophaga sp. BPS33]|uniref:tannase/feruloyl esterase family alpha/beta hydrolase n=1 Tax=Hydrogenophaga sp. BPS33 TaxID=2651974 RepID=UPI00132050EC|nr:tannase/feruloyl esterase family alpha/beta hydrolase [Hydrogenophaga sp. BPS33]QHE85585.1 tannase/feruloyl esterase family alpha/beta hydrolase [Hydrogenophaga sp. BPS33]